MYDQENMMPEESDGGIINIRDRIDLLSDQQCPENGYAFQCGSESSDDEESENSDVISGRNYRKFNIIESDDEFVPPKR